MVLSRIDKSIDYPPVKFIDPDDIEYDAQLYELELFPNLEVILALGNVKYTYVDKKVLYIPVYLTYDNEVLMQIGVYEFPAYLYTSLLDDDNDFDIGLLENPLPLLYKFVTESLVRKETHQKQTTTITTTVAPVTTTTTTAVEVTTLDKKDNSDADADALYKDSRVPNVETVLEMIEDDENSPTISDKMVAEETAQNLNFKPHRGHNWLEKYMRNENYGIQDVESNGDCLFATIRDAFSGIKKSLSVQDLRKIVSDNATQKTFLNFKEQYNMYSTAVIRSGQELIELKKKVDALRKRASSEKDRNKKKEIVELAKPLIKQFRQIKKEKEQTALLLHEYRWMRGINNLKELQKKIRTCAFWAESWAINILELALNTKIIILSSENYNDGDVDNVLLCGEMVSPQIEKKQSFKPKYYIILDYNGSHYKLITYKRTKIFTFDEIPVHLKKMIINKCMEKPTGIYNYIPKFKMLKNRLKNTSNSKVSPGDDAGPEDQGKPDEEKKDEGSELSKKPSFDDTTVFQFYSKSSDKPLPGRGAGEKINPTNQEKYSKLATMTGWRKVLSNFYMAPFKLDDRTWNSVEHYYHANKFKKSHPDFYEQFTVESGSDISTDPAFAKAAGGKSGKYKSKKWKRQKDITIDDDFFTSGRNQTIMEAGQYAKYSQNKPALEVLLATNDAKLQHHVRGQPPVIFYDTMLIRDKLKKN